MQIVVFNRPETYHAKQSMMLKRIAGLPGEHVNFSNGHLVINGEKLTGPKGLTDNYSNIQHNVIPFNFTKKHPEGMKLDRNELFVLGDNPAKSLDSRSFGPVKKSQIVGIVLPSDK